MTAMKRMTNGMKRDEHSDTNTSTMGRMSAQRHQRIAMDISREAARLFWQQGVDATTGNQIADAVGLSVRSIWRYFRNKESCAEPVLMYGVQWFVSVVRTWPPERAFEDHYAQELTTLAKSPRDPEQDANDLAAMRMIVLATTEPALRAVWLMACDQIEQEFVIILGHRLQRSTDDVDVRMHAAAATSVVRVFSEALHACILSGGDPITLENLQESIARAVSRATGGIISAPIVSHRKD
jgi:AcrR family transcriptional regulator